jgi:hypothetical protein
LAKAYRLHSKCSHTGIDLVKHLHKIYDALMSLEWCALKKVQVWAIIIHGIDHFHRESEFSMYCPLVTDVTGFLGPDAMGLSRALKILYRQWKGRREADNRNKTAYAMILHHNPLCAEGSAALWLSFWLEVSGGAAVGPIYGRTEPNGGPMLQAHHTKPGVGVEKGADIWYTEDDKRVNWTSAQVADMIRRVIDRAVDLDKGKSILRERERERERTSMLIVLGKDPVLKNLTVHGLLRVTPCGWAARARVSPLLGGWAGPGWAMLS